MRAVWQRTAVYVPLAFLAVGLGMTFWTSPEGSTPAAGVLGVAVGFLIAYWLGRRSKAEASAVAVANAVATAVADARADAASEAHSQALANVQLVLGDHAMERLSSQGHSAIAGQQVRHLDASAFEHLAQQETASTHEPLHRPGLQYDNPAMLPSSDEEGARDERSAAYASPAPRDLPRTNAVAQPQTEDAEPTKIGTWLSDSEANRVRPSRRARSATAGDQVPAGYGLGRFLDHTSPHEGDTRS